jgi:hypothetical protein
MPVSVLVGFFGFSSKKVMRPPSSTEMELYFLICAQIAHVVEREYRRLFLPAEFTEVAQVFAEQIVAGHHDQIVVHVLRFEDVMDVADGAEFVGVVGRAVVDDGEIQFGFGGAIMVRPFLKMAGEFGVGDDVNRSMPPMGARLSSTCSIIGLPATGSSGLGCVRVSGYRRVAYPAARMMTFIRG